MFRIFITADVAKEAKEILEKEFIVDIQPNMKEEELCQVIGDYDAIITRSQTKVTKAVIDAAKNLKVIGRAGVGIDGIYDLASGSRVSRFADLSKEVGDNMDFIYLDVWGNLTSSGSEDSWETRKMSKMINDNGWRMTTEWGSGNLPALGS